MRIVCILGLIFLSSCATIHKGNWAKPVRNETEEEKYARNKKLVGSKYRLRNATDSGMLVSYEWNSDYSEGYFRYLDFTFENTTPEFKKIEEVSISFKNKEKVKEVFFLKGAPLASFLKGQALKIQIKNRNKAVVAGVMAGVAAGAAASASDSNYANYNSGLVTMAAASAVMNKKANINEFPEEHMFGSKERFLIPPGLALTKYLVMYSKNPDVFGELKTMYVTYRLKDGQEEKLELELKHWWQASKKKRY